MHYVLIDYYRYTAALIVAISHYFIVFYPSPELEFVAILGVELFFPLSGFVLASQLQKLETNKTDAGRRKNRRVEFNIIGQ